MGDRGGDGLDPDAKVMSLNRKYTIGPLLVEKKTNSISALPRLLVKIPIQCGACQYHVVFFSGMKSTDAAVWWISDDIGLITFQCLALLSPMKTRNGQSRR